MVVVHAALLCALIKLPPSPYDLAKEGMMDTLMESLKSLRGIEDVDNEAKSIVKAVEEKKWKTMKTIPGILDLTTLKKIAIIMTVFSFVQFTGINVIVTYVVDIFSSTNISTFTLVVVTSSSEVIFSFFQAVIADKLRR